MVLPIGDPVHLHDICTDSVGCLRRLHQLYGNCVAFPHNGQQTIMGWGQDFNHSALSDSNRYALYGYPGPKGSSHRVFKNGLLGSNGPEQIKHRRLLMPPFRKEAVDHSFASMNRLIEETLEDWRVGDVLDLAATMRGFSLQVTGKLLFGLEEFDLARTVAQTFQEWLAPYHTMLMVANLPIPAPPGQYEQMLDAADRLLTLLREILRQKRATYRPEQRDVLSLLITAFDAGHISEIDLLGEMHTFLNAAYQTTSFGLTWMLFLIAQHPLVAWDLLREQKQVFGNETFTAEHLPKMSWLNCVMKESLRLFPPVVYNIRAATDATTFGPFAVPKFTMVMPSYYISHHVAAVFPNPEQFRPERWHHAEVSPYAYLPFSAGPRMCMGSTFATLLFKMAVTGIFQRFRLEVLPNSRINRHAHLTLGVEGSLSIRLHPQDARFTTSPISGNVLDTVEMPQTIPQVMPERRAA